LQVGDLTVVTSARRQARAPDEFSHLLCTLALAFAQAGYVVSMAEIHPAIGMGSGTMLDKLLPQDRDKDRCGYPHGGWARGWRVAAAHD